MNTPDVTKDIEIFAQKYAIVQLLEPMNLNDEFSSNAWPLHTTIVDTYAVDWSIEEMLDSLNESIGRHDTAQTVAEDDTFFGENGQTRVVLLDRTESIVKLHLDTIAALERGGLKLNDSQFAGDGFLPHATVQKYARLQRGDRVQIVLLSIIDMFPNDDPYNRKLVEEIPLAL